MNLRQTKYQIEKIEQPGFYGRINKTTVYVQGILIKLLPVPGVQHNFFAGEILANCDTRSPVSDGWAFIRVVHGS